MEDDKLYFLLGLFADDTQKVKHFLITAKSINSARKKVVDYYNDNLAIYPKALDAAGMKFLNPRILNKHTYGRDMDFLEVWEDKILDDGSHQFTLGLDGVLVGEVDPVKEEELIRL